MLVGAVRIDDDPKQFRRDYNEAIALLEERKNG